jgi:IclR family acetate operon transcriptional repressor
VAKVPNTTSKAKRDRKDSGAGGDAPTYPIESVNNALKLLTLLQDRPSIGVTEAAQILEVAPSTAHRLFQMLRYHELVEQDSSSRAYQPGPALIHLGMSILRRFDLRNVARPYLARLADETEETVHLSILEGSSFLVIDSIESTRAVRVGTRLGMTFPAHDATSGRVLLAGLPQERLDYLYPNPRIPLTRKGSPTSRAQLFKLLEEIRKDGYAVRVGEATDDVASMAVPIHDHTGTVRGSIGMGIPISRFDTEKNDELLTFMKRAAQRTGEDLP